MTEEGSVGADQVRAVVVSVGDELLLGRTVNTNAAWLGQRLAEVGVHVRRCDTVADEPEEIRTAVSRGLEEADVVLVTGGLGPTPDDLTKEAVAELLGRPLETDGEMVEALTRRFREWGYEELPPANRSQAEVPRGAEAVPNPHGTAPGLILAVDDRRVVLLPGVPREMKGLWEEGVAEILREAFAGRLRPILYRTIHTTGIAESVLSERVGGALPERMGPVSVAFLPDVRGVDLRLTARGVDDPSEAEAWLDRVEEALEPVVGRYRFASERGDVVDAVAEALLSSDRTIATAESCTGGLVAKRLTDRPGSSSYFLGGVVSYSNTSKIRDLGVDEELLAAGGAVSEGVARAMAEGAVARFGSDCGVALTGIAGPTGGTEEKPVGTVWYAVTVDGETHARRTRFPGDRNDVRQRSAQAALALLLHSL